MISSSTIIPTSMKSTEQLDPEWKELLEEARNLGLTIEDIRTFLQSNQSS
ncbi:anti-repressor SinI family protein [Bacillus alkalicellulosilyticus]|nr:anti-repressor SinI family protein [Bacillus alkalicellulosilyticus]